MLLDKTLKTALGVCAPNPIYDPPSARGRERSRLASCCDTLSTYHTSRALLENTSTKIPLLEDCRALPPGRVEKTHTQSDWRGERPNSSSGRYGRQKAQQHSSSTEGQDRRACWRSPTVANRPSIARTTAVLWSFYHGKEVDLQRRGEGQRTRSTSGVVPCSIPQCCVVNYVNSEYWLRYVHMIPPAVNLERKTRSLLVPTLQEHFRMKTTHT